MGSRSDGSLPLSGLAAATKLFPEQSRQIESLFERDESFKGLCEDLADAEGVLEQIATLPASVRDERSKEYRELVADLADDIAEALSRAKVVYLRRDRGPREP